MRIYCALLLHESNSFSPIPTGLEDFEQPSLEQASGPGAAPVQHDLCLRQACLDAGHEVVDGPGGTAVPSAPTRRRDYEALRDRLLDGLRRGAPFDAVLLFLHGAQMAEGYDDCEGDLLTAVRGVVGPAVPVGVLLDLHCNISAAMIRHTDVIVACKEYPHTDFHECARQLVGMIAGTAQRRLRPVMYFQPIPMLGFFHTTREPMRGFVAWVRSLEGRGGILSVSLAHGFPAGDSIDTRAGVVVIADGDRHAARLLALDVARRFFALREDISASSVTAEEALDLALRANDWPVVIADVADNPGGGAPGDSTHLLRQLIERKVQGAALATIWDTVAIDLIRKAGVGARLWLRLGGKSGPLAGLPVDVEAEVLSIQESTTQRVFGTSELVGATAAIAHDGVRTIIAQQRHQTHSPEIFAAHGIEPREQRILVVKSAQHFYTEFSPLARRIIYASPPGVIGNDFSHYPYHNVERPLWPLDRTPITAFGEIWE